MARAARGDLWRWEDWPRAAGSCREGAEADSDSRSPPLLLPTLRVPLMHPLRREATHRSGGSMRGDIDCGFALLTDALSVRR